VRAASRVLHLRSAWAAAFWYCVLTGAITWPLARGLARDVPWDLGDPLLNAWLLAWGADHLWRFVTGDLAALRGFWTANIFHPETLTLAYSEALIPQVLQILPVYGLTKNAILCYNLVFLSTFVLSGLGVYLLVRDLTRDARAAFVAGLFYAFALYRVCQFSHVQVLSSQWMPFVLYGFRRYFESGHLRDASASPAEAQRAEAGRRRALAGAGLALWAQNLSCGYYLFFFAPFVGAYVLYEVLDRGLWREWRALAALAITLAASLAATVPFLLPYLELSARGVKRPLGEIVFYSADVFSYLTAFGAVEIWGRVAQVFPKLEGELFPGVTPMLLAAAAIGAWVVRNWQRARDTSRGVVPRRSWTAWVSIVAGLVLLAHVAAMLLMMVRGRTVLYLAGARIQISSFARLLQNASIAAVALLVTSPRSRAFVRGLPGSSTGFFTGALAAAFLFSLGPRMKTMGENIGTGPYTLLMTLVPGIDSVRVPARFAMLVALFLAILGGVGVAAILRRSRRAGTAVAFAAGLVFLAEGAAIPLPMNTRGVEDGLRLTDPGPMRQGASVAPVYREVAALPAGTVLVEFPFGAFAYEFQYVFYSTNHWKPLLNGYSGFFPPSYDERRAKLSLPRLLEQPDDAWESLRRSGATHAILHENAFLGDEDDRIGAWLEQHGARLQGKFEYDRLYELAKSPELRIQN
jgi:hypothetical protein